jgi:(E)-4-hydroxy-3-methylbut-2-enyl-diphosphate synthase
VLRHHLRQGPAIKKVRTEELVEKLFIEIDKYDAAGKTLVVNDDQAAQAARWLVENENETTI